MKENIFREIAMRLYKVFSPIVLHAGHTTYNLFVFCSSYCYTLPIFAIYARLDFRVEMKFACLLVS